MNRILVVDDHSLVKPAIEHILIRKSENIVIGAARTGREGIRMALSMRPNVIFMDIKMPDQDGIEATRQIIQSLPNVRIICLTGSTDEDLLFRMLNAGAKSIILKTSGTDQIVRAIEAVASGREYFCPEASKLLALRFIGRSTAGSRIIGSAEFSDLEAEIIRLICRQKTTKEIAARLNLAVKTIEYHRHKIIKKAEVTTNIGVVLYALRYRLVTLDECL